MTEEWRSVLDGYYEVSNTGRVRRLRAPRAGRELSINYAGAGYARVAVCVNGVERGHFVHRLVAEAFCVRPSGCDVVNHIDGDKRNASPENLEWTTSAGNSEHAASTGLAPSGSRHGRTTKPSRTARGERVNTARLVEDEVIEARALRASGWTLTELCDRFGISKSAMHALCTRKNWKHIK